MGPFEMVVFIVLICTAGSIIGKYMHSQHAGDGDGKGKAKGKGKAQDRPDWDWDWGMGGGDAYSKKELKPYLEKIDSLEERIRVLERIVTDKGTRLSREIDELQ